MLEIDEAKRPCPDELLKKIEFFIKSSEISLN